MQDIFIYGVLALILVGVILYFSKNKRKSFLFMCIGLNLCISPLSLLLGFMSTDSPNSTMKEFYEGFFLIQGIPLILLLISFFILYKKRSL